MNDIIGCTGVDGLLRYFEITFSDHDSDSHYFKVSKSGSSENAPCFEFEVKYLDSKSVRVTVMDHKHHPELVTKHIM